VNRNSHAWRESGMLDKLALLMATEIEGGEAVVSNSKLLRGCMIVRLLTVPGLSARVFLLGCNVGCRIATLSFCGNSQLLLPTYVATPVSTEPHLKQWVVVAMTTLLETRPRYGFRTLSMCSNVVLPALSRPRKSSLACLLRRPSEARTS
jgi:hypothetical protein